RGLVMALDAPLRSDEPPILNLGDNLENYQLRDLKEELETHVPGVRVTIETEKEDLRTYRVRFDRIEREWGFRATRRVGDGIEEVARDVRHSSIGHVTPVIYALMAERGYFPLVDLLGFRQFKGHLQGHPSKHDTPGIEVSSGSLGQGLSVACGMALGSRMDGNKRRV